MTFVHFLKIVVWLAYSKIHLLCVGTIVRVLANACNYVKPLQSRYRTVPSSFRISSFPLVVRYSSDLQSLAATDLFSVLIVLFFSDYHTNEIMQYIVFWVCLPSPSIMHLRFMHFATYISCLFLFIAVQYFIIHTKQTMYRSLFILSPVEGH